MMLCRFQPFLCSLPAGFKHSLKFPFHFFPDSLRFQQGLHCRYQGHRPSQANRMTSRIRGQENDSIQACVFHFLSPPWGWPFFSGSIWPFHPVYGWPFYPGANIQQNLYFWYFFSIVSSSSFTFSLMLSGLMTVALEPIDIIHFCRP